MPLRSRSLLIAAVLATAPLAACHDSTGPGARPNQPGTFTATASGAVVVSFSGDAFFYGEADDASSFVIEMVRTGASGATTDDYVHLGRFNAARPAVGSYVVADGGGSWGDDEFVMVAYATGADGNQYRCISTSSSTLKITTSTADVVAGSYETPVQCQRTPEGGPWTAATVKGSFSAKHQAVNENPL